MMSCQRCDGKRIASVSGKCSDMCSFSVQGADRDIEGSVPYDMNIGGGDYIELTICLDCGQAMGTWPVTDDHPKLVEMRACHECGGDTGDDGNCGPCANCKLPACVHDFDSKDCPQEYP